MRPCALVVAMLVCSTVAAEERATDTYLDQTRERWTTLAKKIWDTPETALNEKKSAQALVEALQKEGFRVTWGVGGEPTAFVATAGSGSPTLGLLAEYDALPGLSQKAGTATAGGGVSVNPTDDPKFKAAMEACAPKGKGGMGFVTSGSAAG